jgi:molybdopterin converting factor subunit 1
MSESSVTVRLFAQARECAEVERVLLAAGSVTTIGEVRCELARLYPNLAPVLARSALALNHNYVRDDNPVSPGDEVAVIPPVAGG